MPITLNLRWRL